MSKKIKETKTKEDKNLSINIRKVIYLFIKRLFDIIVGLIGLIVLIPVIIVIKIVYLCNKDVSSIFYSQIRVGKNGKKFKLYKLRSMVPNSAEMLEEMLKDPKYKKEWDENQKFENDPRITKLGKIIRKTSIDELPQMLNVLLGDMSLIGPRPLIPGELEKFNGDHKKYEAMKPGITGWWAANGRSEVDYDTRLELEYYYCEHASILLDIKCIFKTIAVVLFRKGAK